ncbi:hypothetical protein [Clostridium culturomicium]|uniref:hypothetical protein n=1 Tax=Clostridium culturomicium TaxID=1499683 RepID=UPI003857E26B
MTTLKSFIYCEGIDTNITPNGPKPSLVSPLAALTPMFIPSMYSFSIFMSIQHDELNCNNSFRIVFRKKDSDLLIVDSGSQLLPPLDHESDLPKEARGFMINMDLKNVVIKEEGMHICEVYINDILIGGSEIYAKAAENNG